MRRSVSALRLAPARLSSIVPPQAVMLNSVPSPQEVRSLAVLPFVNMSSDPENEYFSDGITEEIINALTRVQRLSVTARTSAFSFKNKNIDIRAIGRQLGVTSVLEGSVRKGADTVRITAKLIRAEDGFLLWSERFDRKLEDIFAVQDEISLRIADQVRENFGHLDIGDRLVEHPAISAAEYQLFLKGRYHLHRFNKDDIKRGIEIFRQVVLARPDFALAHASIHYGYNMMAAAGLMPVKEALTIGEGHLDRALQLDERLPECHHSLGWHVLNWRWDFIGATKHLGRAIELRPGYADAHQKMFITLALEGNLDSAYEHLQTAYRLDPLAALNNYFMGYHHYLTGALDTAHSYFVKTFEIEPGFMVGYAICALSLALQGRPDEILRVAARIPEMEGADEEREIMHALAHAARGDTAGTEAAVHSLQAALQGPHQERVRFFLVYIETLRGNARAAFAHIDEGVQRREPLMTLLKVDPLLRPLHADPAWASMLTEVYALSDDGTEAATVCTAPRQPDPAQAERHEARLLALMQQAHPHRDPNLSLRDLAARLDMHPNALSRLLNERIGDNFNAFVNRHRLQDFKAKALDPANRHITLLGLAMDAGFNSKTVFNAFFKKTTGMTPRAWLKAQTG